MRAELVLLGGAPLALVACGGATSKISAVSSKPGKLVSTAVLTRALLKTASAPSEHVTIAQSTTLSLPWPLSKSCTTTSHTVGDIDDVHRMSRFDGPSGSVVLSGTTEYEKNGKRWVEVPHVALFGRSFPLSSAGFGSLQPVFLKLLRPHRVAELGPALINGARTTAYRVWIGADKGLRQPVEMWTDRSGRIRQARFASGGGKAVTVGLSRFGEHVHITAPKNAVPQPKNGPIGAEFGVSKGQKCK